MKNFALLFTLLFISISCSKNLEASESTEYSGKWTLVKMSGSRPNSETTGSAMEWQESYVFNNDGTFIKSRESNSLKTTASGKYSAKQLSDGMYLELNYNQDSEIIGSCTGNQKEELRFMENNSMSSTWNHCDGPTLIYQKTN